MQNKIHSFSCLFFITHFSYIYSSLDIRIQFHILEHEYYTYSCSQIWIYMNKHMNKYFSSFSHFFRFSTFFEQNSQNTDFYIFVQYITFKYSWFCENPLLSKQILTQGHRSAIFQISRQKCKVPTLRFFTNISPTYYIHIFPKKCRICQFYIEKSQFSSFCDIFVKFRTILWFLESKPIILVQGHRIEVSFVSFLLIP